jgi:serine/threonine protein kinase
VQTESHSGLAYTLALRPGTLLDGVYQITSVLRDTSTFAITYLAQHQRSGDRFVIKEFLPRAFAGRAPDELTVHPHSASDEASLARVLRRFKREVELLADIAHPNIPRVRRQFEANGTGYVVFQHYDGKTLADLAGALDGGRLPADRATSVTVQVLQGLEALHAEGIIHGFITPESVLVDDNSRALVLGLGTTRHVVGPAREPVAGFAPIEQYAAKEVGPWTDVYACAALLYRLTTGLIPPSAVERSTGQAMPMPWGPANVPQSLAQAITTGLAQLPDTRPHSAEEFRRRLEAALAPAVSRLPTRVEERVARLEERPAVPRWALSETPDPDPIEQLAAQAQLREIEDESGLDYEALLRKVDTPANRMRRFVRMALGLGGAAAGIFLTVSLLGSRKTDNGWAAGDVAAATPAAIGGSATLVDLPRGEPKSAPRADGPRRPTRSPSAESAPKPGSPAGPRAQRENDEAGTRARQASRSSPTVQQASAPVPAAGQSRTPDGPPSVTVSVPASIGKVEILPAEALSGLRERLAHGQENVESGEYARARQIYAAALEQLAKLNEQYAGTQSLQAMKHEIEQAAGRASAACAAENEVALKRNRRPVQCQ